jgi:hypothetical protein
MKSIKGAISTGMIVGLSLLAVVGIVVFTCASSYISAYNYGNRAERNIEAAWTNNQNVLGQYTLKVQELVQVPEMYKNDLKEVVTSALSARYGANGSKAVMNWLKESNIPFDSKLYVKMAQVIESGRNEFTREQTRLIDEKRAYETQLGYFWTGFWLRMAGYPKIDLAKFKPVVAGDTAATFEKGVQAPIKLR